MEWADEGIVLGTRGLGEASVVLELMTRAHGRHLGLVHGGRSTRLRAALQPGNGVHAVWRARLDEQLGHYVVEVDQSRAARLIGSEAALLGIATLAAELRLLPERDPHARLFDLACELANRLDQPGLGAAFVHFETALLAELGFGLDLASCAATGAREELVYVSPRSGRAVSRAAGALYHDRLLTLPRFLIEEDCETEPSTGEIAAGFRLTGHFLEVHVLAPRDQRLPDARARLIALATRSQAAGSARLVQDDPDPGDSSLSEVP